MFHPGGSELRNQLLSGCEKRVRRGFSYRHSDKFCLEGSSYLLQAGLQELVRRAIVAQDVCEKCLVGSVIYSCISKQVLDIEQISRMLSVQSCNQFPCVEVGKRKDLDLSEAELLLHDGPECFQLRGEQCREARE